MMIGLMLSKITGHLREILVVPILGYGVVSDAYVIGFQIPDLFYQLLIGGAIQAAITPTLAAAIEQNKERKGWRSISIFINYAALVMLVAVVAGELLAPVLIPIYNHGKLPEITTLAVPWREPCSPRSFFMMLAALSIGILNAYRKFGSTSFGPTVYNICVVLAMVFLGSASPSGAVRVAAGVMGCSGSISSCSFAWPAGNSAITRFPLIIGTAASGRLMHLALPTLLSGSIVQINTIILTVLPTSSPGLRLRCAMQRRPGSCPMASSRWPSAMSCCRSLAGLYATRNLDGCRKLLTQSLRSALFLTIPSAALFLAMQQDVIRAIFQWGAANSEQTVGHTASVLRWYCLAMVAQTVVFMINQAYYAQQQTRWPLLNGLWHACCSTDCSAWR